MARGEVALIVTQTAVSAGLPDKFMIMTVMLILVSSILTPILLKVLYGREKKPPEGGLPEVSEESGADVIAEATAENSGSQANADA